MHTICKYISDIDTKDCLNICQKIRQLICTATLICLSTVHKIVQHEQFVSSSAQQRIEENNQNKKHCFITVMITWVE